MFHFTMGMPLYLMALYGSVMLVLILLLRALLKNKLPKFVFPILWCMVLIRLLVPFSLSTPISTPLSQWVATWSTLVWQDNYASELINVVTYEPGAVSGTSNEFSPTSEVIISNSDTTYVKNDSTTVEVASESDVVAGSFSVPFLPYSTNWINVLISVYVIGVVGVTLYLGWQKMKYSRILKGSLLVEHNEVINNILRTMGMGHVLVFTSDHIASPLVSGWVHPRIYLPSRMDFQNTQCLHHILIHEVMHIKRKDNWVKVLMIIAICLNWYNPLIWIMSKCLSSDIEAACDAAVLKALDGEERAEYASSLLAMAITGDRPTLLYSAFSKTEVEKRIRAVIEYKKAPFLLTLISVLLLTMGSVAFAGSAAAPFSEYLSSYCSSTECKWGAKATLNRDIALGDYSQDRADKAIFKAMERDHDNDREMLKENILNSLSEEFGVEKGAFEINISLILATDARDDEYKEHGITKTKTGFYYLDGKHIRVFIDEMGSLFQTTWADGEIDVTIERDTKGNISDVIVLREGDSIYDERTRENGRFTWH